MAYFGHPLPCRLHSVALRSAGPSQRAAEKEQSSHVHCSGYRSFDPIVFDSSPVSQQRQPTEEVSISRFPLLRTQSGRSQPSIVYPLQWKSYHRPLSTHNLFKAASKNKKKKFQRTDHFQTSTIQRPRKRRVEQSITQELFETNYSTFDNSA